MSKLLLSFGDSWAYGAELPLDSREQENYTGQLSKMLEVDQVKNFSESGSSISHLQIQLRNAVDAHYDNLKNSTATAVFFLTGQQRFLFFDYQGEFSVLSPSGPVIRPHQKDLRNQFDQINDFYYKNIQSKQADDVSLNTNLLALQSICKYYGIKDYYISGWEPLNLWPEVDINRIYDQGQKTCADILDLDHNFKHDYHIVTDGSHPNATGHALIAQTLFKMMTNTL